MAEVTGYTNEVYVLAGTSAMSGSTGAKILGISNSTFNKLCEMLDKTAFGDNYRKRKGGLKDNNITINGYLYVGDTTGQDVLVPGADIYIGTYPSGTGVAGTQIPAVVESVEIGSAVDGLTTFTANISGNGAAVALPLRP